MKALTIGILAVAVAVMAFAGVSAPKTDATSSLCHSTHALDHGARERQGGEERSR